MINRKTVLPVRGGQLILIVSLLLLAQVPDLQAQKRTSLADEVTVEEAIDILKSKEGYSFIFKTDDLDLKRKVSVDLENTEISSLIESIFKNQNVTFKVNGKMVLVEKNSSSQFTASAVSRLIKGQVTDNRGEPLVGVGIFIPGSGTGALSDFNGKYEIQAYTGAVLQFSCLGYETTEAKVGKSDKVNVVMIESVNDLDEAVVIGYGVIKKSDLTGAVSSVKTDNLPKSSNTSIAHMLSGRAAGVTAVQNSAQPGGGVEMLVRGAASTGAGNAPLYIIDGFPVSGASVEPATDNRYSNFGSRNPLNSINPNDIESIEILKDASSTAIYGARAANGVIIITTRKGREGRASVSYNASYGVQQIANKIEMMNATEFMLEANRFAEEKWYYDNRVYPYGNTEPSAVKEKRGTAVVFVGVAVEGFGVGS